MGRAILGALWALLFTASVLLAFSDIGWGLVALTSTIQSFGVTLIFGNHRKGKEG